MPQTDMEQSLTSLACPVLFSNHHPNFHYKNDSVPKQLNTLIVMLMFQFDLFYLITVYIKGALSYLSLMKNHYKKWHFEMFNIRVGHHKGPMLHLSLSPCTGSAYRTATGSAPSYFHSLITIYIPSRSLRSESNASWYHHREAQNHSPERFHSPFLAGGMNFPPLSVMLDPCQFSSDTWKLISSVITSLSG